jgi:hypothetical protein
MGHYAQVNKDNIVVQVLTTNDNDENVEQWLLGSFGPTWLKVSYNTRGGIHYGKDNKPDGGIPVRYNYPGVGYLYDPEADAFYCNTNLPSWVLNKTTYLWEPPIPKPENLVAIWNEETVSWDLIPSPYPSWIYIDNGWFPPTPCPGSGPGWSWDEESISWIRDNPMVKADND